MTNIRKLGVLLLLCGLHLEALADGETMSGVSKMSESGAATPSVGGDVRGQPNLFDLEFVTARLTMRAPDKTLTTVTAAPFLRPDYDPWASELRLGIHAESSGVFGIGVGWGYNQARRRLASTPLPPKATESAAELATRKKEIAARRARLEPAVQLVCAAAKRYEDACSPSVGDKLCDRAKTVVSECQRQSGNKNLAAFADSLSGVVDDLAVGEVYVQADMTNPLVAARVAFAEAAAEMFRAGDEYSAASNAAAKKADDKVIKKARKDRLENAYRRSLGINAFASTSLFPIVKAPDIAPMTGMGAPRDAFASRFRSLDLGVAARFHVSRRALLQVRGGQRWDRVSAVEGTERTGEFYFGLDLAAIKLFSDGPDESGFQPGIGGGLSVLFYGCEEDGGCATELELGDQYPKTAPLKRRTQITGFVEWRVRKEFQVRIAADLFIDDVEGQITGTDPAEEDPRLIHMTPSLSVGAAFWGL